MRANPWLVTLHFWLLNITYFILITYAFQELVLLPKVHHSQIYFTIENKYISFNFRGYNVTLKFVSHVTRGTPKNSQCLWITFFFNGKHLQQSITFILLLTLWQTY